MLAENTSLLSRVGHEDCSNFLEKNIRWIIVRCHKAGLFSGK